MLSGPPFIMWSTTWRKNSRIYEELCDEDGINPAIAIIGGETPNLGMLERVKKDSEIHFIPVMAGGETR